MNVSHKSVEMLQAARSVFDGYALSPEDRDEAVGRYMQLANTGSSGNNENKFVMLTYMLEENAVESILYSINCENVWRRNTV